VNNIKKYLFFISFILIIIGFILIKVYYLNNYDTKYISISIKSGNYLKGKLFIPKFTREKEKYSAVVLCHGVIVNKEYMETMAITFAQNGMVALTFDLGGYGESYKRQDSDEKNVQEILTAVNYLRSLPFVDAKKIGIVGHSMGGTAVVLAGIEDLTIQAVACLGMSVKTEPFKPCNLLWTTGLYDPLHVPGEMRRALALSTNNIGYLEKTTHNRNNCQHLLFLSSTANHQTEMFDYYELKEVAKWMKLNLDGLDVKPLINLPFFNTGIILVGMGLFMVICLLICQYSKKRFISGSINILIIVLLLFGYYKILEPFLCSSIIIFLLFVMLTANFWTPQNSSSLINTGLLIFIIIACIDIVNIINVFWEYINNPEYIWGIPIYLFQTWLNYLPLSFITWRPHFFIQYTSVLIPAWSLIVVLSVELILPGIILKVVTTAGSKLISICQFKLSEFKIGKMFSRQGLMLLILVIALGILIWQRAYTGFINSEALTAVSAQFIRRYLPTFIFVIVLLRQINIKKGGIVKPRLS